MNSIFNKKRLTKLTHAKATFQGEWIVLETDFKCLFLKNRLVRTKNFPKKHFLPPDTHMHVCVSGGKKG